MEGHLRISIAFNLARGAGDALRLFYIQYIVCSRYHILLLFGITNVS